MSEENTKGKETRKSKQLQIRYQKYLDLSLECGVENTLHKGKARMRVRSAGLIPFSRGI